MFKEHLEPREWKLRTDATFGEAELNALQRETGFSSVTLRVCLMRGMRDAASIKEYLNPRLDHLKRPALIKDMDLAVARIARARANLEKIRIYGDYDVDGTTGAALLSWIFRDCALSFDALQPDRFKDGYGLGVKAVEDAGAAGVRVLVTVDCGISSFDAALKARQLGIDLIIIDHHQIDPIKGLPVAHAVVNPQRTDCESELKQLCGCGLAFYLAMALRSHGRDHEWFVAGKEPNLKQHLDLVAMATAADMVPLTGDNHILIRHGMDVLKATRKPGVRALLQAAGVLDKELSPSHLGFVIGPRINASGRMLSAGVALELLTTTDSARAADLARQIEQLNEERQTVQNEIWDQVRARVEKGIAEGKYQHGIVVADSEWHEGVVGIVASRVTETFRRPAIVIALREDFGKGSARSYGGKDVLAALRVCSAQLLGFGGHKYAAGVSVALEKVEEFALAFDHALSEVAEDATLKPLLIEGACSIHELDVKTLGELEKLGPFGPGNPEPIFTFKAAVRDHRVLKGRHLKLNLSPVGTPNGRQTTMEAIWFGGAEREEILSEALGEEEAEWAGVPELNRFRGNVTPTLRVRDWRKIPRDYL